MKMTGIQLPLHTGLEHLTNQDQHHQEMLDLDQILLLNMDQEHQNQDLVHFQGLDQSLPIIQSQVLHLLLGLHQMLPLLLDQETLLDQVMHHEDLVLDLYHNQNLDMLHQTDQSHHHRHKL